MESEIILTLDTNLVEVKLFGFVSLEKLKKEGLRLREYALTFGKMKYLVDVRETMAMPSVWSNTIAKPDNWWTLTKLCNEIAIVIREDDSSYLQNIDMIARYTGAKVRLFHTAESGYKWLGAQ